MIKVASIVVALLSVLSVAAQSSVELSSLEHNFGEIAEDGGDVSSVFIVKNITSRPIVIRGVRTTCSCVTARYQRRPILPQEVDTLSVTFDPRFRAGSLHRELTLYIQGDSIPTLLTLRGYVTHRD